MKILVTGGCGYIGSHTIVDLIKHGHEVISIDNNICSNLNILEGVQKITGQSIKNYNVDLCDREKTIKVFKEHKDIEGILHFAAFKSVEESTENPLMYYKNNLLGLMNILDCIKIYSIPYFVFSSSCSVYGNVNKLPVTENTPLGEAESPYARTKQMSEMIIKDFSIANPQTKNIILRYFNPAGAHDSNYIGEVSFGKPVTLVPVIMDVGSAKREHMTVYGTDYDTRDGSCVRDYIYIMDLAHAHTKAIEYTKTEKYLTYEIFNLGTGTGITVLEMVKAFEKTTGKSLNIFLGERRAGDVIEIYADYDKAKEKLGWIPKYGIEDIMRTAWNWEMKTV